MAALNYATQYFQALAQAFPYVLNFGALWASPNASLYKPVDAKTIKIPVLTTTGRVDGSRDTIGGFTRNFDNDWETKTLSNHRTWNTLVHPVDINQTNLVATIQNITKVFNEENKFPEMDAYAISKIYTDWAALGKTPNTTALTTDNILSIFDTMMEAMDEARVPQSGRLLYVTPTVNTLLKSAAGLLRNLSVDTGGSQSVNRLIARLDEVQKIVVTSDLMKTAYDFTSGWLAGATAKQINMLLIHPLAVLPAVNYSFAQLDSPGALSQGKWVYFEEAFEDMFLLNNKAGGIMFHTAATAAAGLTVVSAAGATAGTTALTVTPAKGSGNAYKYKLGLTVAAPAVLSTLDETWTTWDGEADIEAEAGQKICVAEVDSGSHVLKAGIANVTVNAG